MTADQELSLAYHFADLTGPRINRSRLHDPLDIVAIALGAVVAGAESWDEIEEFGNPKHAWLKTSLDLPNGIPSHDTLRRVFERLDPDEFQRGSLRWVEAVHEATERQVVALDGKSLRRSFDRAKGQSPLHRVHAWATANHLLLGQVAVDEESDAITAIPELLKMVESTGAIVTIDALGCPKQIARTLRERGADYVPALKGDHDHLFEQVQASFDGACADRMKGPDIRYQREWDEGHGRTECRRCWATSDLSRLEGREEWKDLESVVMIEAERFAGEALSVETRSYLSSLSNDAKLRNEAVRSRWGVEDSLHWVLDVTSHEDHSRITRGNAPEDFGSLRRLA
jgi:predicted transposase YbfD/YdcC